MKLVEEFYSTIPTVLTCLTFAVISAKLTQIEFFHADLVTSTSASIVQQPMPD